MNRPQRKGLCVTTAGELPGLAGPPQDASVVATTASTVAGKACLPRRQCSAASRQQIAKVLGRSFDPDSIFATVFPADEHDRKVVGGDQATVATTTSLWFSSTASHATNRLTANRGEERKSHCGQLWI